MDAMLPVWDFSLPEFEQLQAEQAEFIWNPLVDVPDTEVPSAAALPAKMTQASVSLTMLDTLTTSDKSSQSRKESLWERDLATMPQVTAHASSGKAGDPGRQDSLLPSPSPEDHTVEDFDDKADEAQQRQRTNSSDTTERSKAVNRESQRRFRLRQKASLVALFVPFAWISQYTRN